MTTPVCAKRWFDQLSLYEEFDAIRWKPEQSGSTAGEEWPYRSRDHGCGASRISMAVTRCGSCARTVSEAPVIMLTGRDFGRRHHPRAGIRRERLRDEAVSPPGAAGAHPRATAPAPGERRREFLIGPYTFRPSSKLLVTANGRKIRLTEKESSVLRHLYRAGRQPVSREQLLQEVWGYNSASAPTHWKRTSIACGRKSSATLPFRRSW